MKVLYIADILKNINTEKRLPESKILGWLKSKRHLGGIIFLEIEDSTGSVKVIVERNHIELDGFNTILKMPRESCVEILFKMRKVKDTLQKELIARKIKIISEATLHVDPYPRDNFTDIFNEKHSEKQIDSLLKRRHLFLRNPKLKAVIKIKAILLEAIRKYLKANKFLEIDTPILTQATLYRDSNTFEVDYFGTKTYLSQCAGLYLEAALPAFEKVYTITPAFRSELSKSPRHNPEFWHAKAQLAFCNYEEMMKFVENMLYNIAKHISKKAKTELKILEVVIDLEKLRPPYPKISYTEALNFLNKKGLNLKWGTSLNEKAEKVISHRFDKPVYVTGMPRAVEPFPYLVDDLNPRSTKTADLIATDGYGEILGIAEFIYKPDELIKRLKECGKFSEIKRFEWYLELKQYGSVPHSGFGMGVERVLRWLLKLPHVRDTFPFPRLYHRKPYP